jgi:hypothetical protein
LRKSHAQKLIPARKRFDLVIAEKGLGKAFTPPVREAWVVCYTSIAREMMEGTGHREALP